jgi:hypothetical protein
MDEPVTAPLPYRFGTFEAWFHVAGATALVVLLVVYATGQGFTGIPWAVVVFFFAMYALIFLMGVGLLRKRRFALYLVHARLGIAVAFLLTILIGLLVTSRESWGGVGGPVDQLLRRVGGWLAWSAPTARYYYRRRAEFH